MTRRSIGSKAGETIRLTIDPSRCVLCGEPNECALARPGADGTERCWCVDRIFPAELTERATATDAGGSCICPRCLEVQGFLFSRPIPPSEMQSVLERDLCEHS